MGGLGNSRIVFGTASALTEKCGENRFMYHWAHSADSNREIVHSTDSNSLCDPLQTIIEAITSKGAAGLDVPVVVFNAVERNSIGYLCRSHGFFEVLLVRVYKHNSILQIFMWEQLEQFVFYNRNSGSVCTVYDYNDSMSSSVVGCP
nr:hypothetical protein Iba_scaffold8938CG0010 [Ipomoea batatas]